MIVVLDASAGVKLVLDESGSDVVRRVWDEPVEMLAPTVIVPEVAAAITAAHRDERIDRDDATSAHEEWKHLVQGIDVRLVDDGLAEHARRITERDPVRGMDAIYLAVAAELDDGADVGLLSFDGRQREAAAALRLALLPASVPEGA